MTSRPMGIGAKVPVFAVAMLCVLVAELIGKKTFSLGPGAVILLPMLWALLMTAIWAGLLGKHLPSMLAIGRQQQIFAAAVLQSVLLFFIVRMGLTVGGALPAIRAAGWALIFQEAGHFFGTMALGLPLALLLGIKREAVGATFSVGRESSLIIVGQRYGLASPEGRGVMAEYITGTVLGALFLATLAGFIASLNIFDPRSLAMGAGVGSSSLMAAALGAVIAQTDPAMHGDLTAIAAASNLLTGVGGFYFTMLVSLPFCSWLYDRLEPLLGRVSRPVIVRDGSMGDAIADGDTRFGPSDMVMAWAFMCVGTALSNHIGFGVPIVDSLEGLAVVIGITAIVLGLKKAIPRLPVLIVLSFGSAALSVPGISPVLDLLVSKAASLNLLAFTTPVLALAGFSVAKDLPIFRQLGWRIVVVSLSAGAGTFLGAIFIAEFFH